MEEVLALLSSKCEVCMLVRVVLPFLIPCKAFCRNSFCQETQVLSKQYPSDMSAMVRGTKIMPRSMSSFTATAKKCAYYATL
jgi:hypothetical protein